MNEKYISSVLTNALSYRKRIRFAGFASLLALLLPVMASKVQAQSALDGFDPNANDIIRVVVVQPDGKILLGGDFTSLAPNGGPPVTRNRIARLNPDGTLDAAFNPDADGTVYSIAVQADGKIVAGGFFSDIGGQFRFHIARLDAVTGLADSLDPTANNTVQAVAVQPNGKILLGGSFTTLSPNGGAPVTRNRIAQLNPDGTLDTAFNADANGTVFTIALQADGKILTGGNFGGPNSIGGQQRNGIARLDPTTGLADSFNPNVQTVGSHVLALAVQADGKVLAGGFFQSVGGQSRNNIARLDATTGLPDSFDPNANARVLTIAVQADGKILTGGSFVGANSIGGQTRNRIARLDATTGLADSFDPNMTSSDVRSIAVQPDGKVLAVGAFTSAGGQTRNRIARLETDGGLDRTLDLGIVLQFGDGLLATAVQADGKILIGGQFNNVLGVPRGNIARLNADGTLDLAFNPIANDRVFAIGVQPDGKILAGGHFTSIGGQTRNRIARLEPATGSADSFDPNANLGVVSIALQADGKILVGGSFTSIGAQARNRIARLDATTGTADSFDPNSNNLVYGIAVQADGKVLAGGDFTGIGGQVRNHIARLDATTGLADSFNPNANNSVLPITIQADGKILVGGFFSNIGGQTRYHIARLDPVSGLADAFNPAPIQFGPIGIRSIAMQSDGKIIIGGNFTSMGGQSLLNFARLDATSGLADLFNPDPGHQVAAITMRADGKILVGGSFMKISGQPRNRFARLSNDTPALQDLIVTQTGITWVRGGSSPHLIRVAFEYSIYNANYSPLGHGTATGSSWTLTGLNLPAGQNFYIRARGSFRGGYVNGSESVVESMRNVFLAEQSVTPTPTATPTPTPTPGCADDTWTATSTANAPSGRVGHGAVWTGSEMIIWGGWFPNNYLNTGGRYSPTMDNWIPTSTTDAPSHRQSSTFVWSGSELIVWGGGPGIDTNLNTGGRYNPGTDSWRATSTTNAPTGRHYHKGVWTGSELIVWGGSDGTVHLNTGGRYSPAMDSWIPTSTTNAPAGRILHTVIWTGSELIVWGGRSTSGVYLNTGGRYNPATNSWTAISTTNAPIGRHSHTAVWTGSEMVVWGGRTGSATYSNTGGRYNPSTDNWTPTSTTNAPSERYVHTAVWTGDEMIVWGGVRAATVSNTGGRYDPLTDGWTAISSANVPTAREEHTAVWTGEQMIVWGGDTSSPFTFLDTGGKYCAQPPPTQTPTPTPTVSPSPTPPIPATPTPTPTSTPSPTSSPPTTPTPSPTPASPTPTPTAPPSATPSTPTPTPAPTATPTSTSTPTPTPPTPTSTPTPTAAPGILGNISTRLCVETGDNVLIGGFIVTGTQPKKVIVRAIGPSLSPFFPAVLADPILELRDSLGSLIAVNDNWRSDQESEIIATTIPPGHDLESAIVVTLPANNSAYTAIIRGLNNGAGIGVVEAYDLDQTVDSKLANISTRGLVQTGDNVLIGGLIVLGQNPLRVIARALGPSLPVAGALGNPVLDLHDGEGTLVASNDDWREDPAQESEIIATGIPPANDLESAMVWTLAPGPYTAIVRGENNTTGVAVVEVYRLD